MTPVLPGCICRAGRGAGAGEGHDGGSSPGSWGSPSTGTKQQHGGWRCKQGAQIQLWGEAFASAEPSWVGFWKALPSLGSCIMKGEVKILGRLQKETEVVWKPEKLPCSGSAEELSLSDISKGRVRGDMIIISKCLHREKIPATKGSSIK